MRFQLFFGFIPLVLADLPDGVSFWWTALGDSYASGVGAGAYTGGNRCLRYDQAYPAQMQGNNDLGLGETPEDQRRLQNCACSGAEVKDMNWQLLDADDNHQPNIQYGKSTRLAS